jgi:GTPase SAR1 family protein
MSDRCVYCPYCYEEISGQPVWFRCTGGVSRAGRRCDPEIDEVLREHTGYGGALPPAFAASGQPASADCPKCGSNSTAKICPICHSRLPVHFGKVGSRLIALVGAKESGKTVFMTVLVHELIHQTGRRLKATISGADDNTLERFPEEYERPLYHDFRLLPPTTTAGKYNRVPLVFRLNTESHGQLGQNGWLPGRTAFSKSQRRQTLLSIFDTAGEDLRSQQSVEQNVRYLAAADGIVLLLDPLQMRGARGLVATGTRMPKEGTTADEPAAVLEKITNLVMAREQSKPNEQISKPLAIVFTKMDALLHDLKETSPLLRPSAQTSYFDERDSLEVHTEIQRLLFRWDGPQIDDHARENYLHYRYFGLSALGETPTQDNRVSARGIRPHRIASPVLWILAQFGTFPVKRG